MDTFTPALAPSLGLTRSVQPRVLRAQFGDGYTQRAGDGLNSIPLTLSLSWDLLDIADADAIEAFFLAHPGTAAFLWTDPREAAPRKWLCTSWNRASPQGLQDSISATFEQVFDL